MRDQQTWRATTDFHCLACGIIRVFAMTLSDDTAMQSRSLHDSVLIPIFLMSV